ncbi:GMP synthase, partial [Mesorhizobium sp. M7A.F.Ca.CA.001.05.1.1]
VYGFQFHFEADRPMVKDWSASFAPTIAARHPDWAGKLDGEMARNGPDADAAGLAIARAWVATI